MNTDDNSNVMPNSFFSAYESCHNCGSHQLELRGYSMIWHDGDIMCASCGSFVRTFDAG